MTYLGSKKCSNVGMPGKLSWQTNIGVSSRALRSSVSMASARAVYASLRDGRVSVTVNEVSVLRQVLQKGRRTEVKNESVLRMVMEIRICREILSACWAGL
jgi:hypothetical protein